MPTTAAEIESLRREIERLQFAASKDRNLLDTILRDSPHGILVCDEHGALTMQNPAAETIWAGSATAGSVAEWGQYRGLHPDGTPFIGSDWGMAASLRERRTLTGVERHILRFDGTEGWLLASSTPLVDGAGTLLGAISIFADITALKTTQAQLQRVADERALMARAADLFASSLAVDAVLTELAQIVVPRLGDWCAVDVVDPAAAPRGVRRLIVHHRDPTMIELAGELQRDYPTDPSSPASVDAVIRASKSYTLAEITDDMIVRGASSPAHLALLRKLALRSIVIAPIACRGEVFGAITVVSSDPGRPLGSAEIQLIEELAVRAALSVANARLYVEAEAKASALEVERKALAASNAELDQFAYAASHDLRAPLRGIANLATWIEEDLGAEMPNTVASNLALLRGRVLRMDNLINAILALSRVGRVKSRPVRVDLGELVREAVDLLGPIAPATVTVRGELPTILAERTALAQVLQNLISNALKHADRHDVAVEISCTRQPPTSPDEIEIAVADNGVGIPVEHHERVWKMFQTLRPRDVVENTGIGLALVRKHVEAAGGRTWIDPTATVGATFRFTWPVGE